MPILYAGDDGWTDWQLPPRHQILGCCDCEFIHDVEFRVVLGKRLNPARRRVEYRVSRDTAAIQQSTPFIHAKQATSWSKPLKACRIDCPRCGLVHAFEFRVVEVGALCDGDTYPIMRFDVPGRVQFRMQPRR
jgi:hypothetical protein